ncbi:MAG: PqqD family protein [Anaerosacchariphilus sp.]
MKKKKNYLDFVPVCAPGYSWKLNEKKLVEIEVQNKGFYNWLAQKFFKRPKVSYISLDEYGSFVWRQMDGQRTIYDISFLVKECYGEEAEPLLPRLTKFFQILYQNHYIGYSTPLEKKKQARDQKILRIGSSPSSRRAVAFFFGNG